MPEENAHIVSEPAVFLKPGRKTFAANSPRTAIDREVQLVLTIEIAHSGKHIGDEAQTLGTFELVGPLARGVSIHLAEVPGGIVTA